MNATERLKQAKPDLIKKYAQRHNGMALYQILSTMIPYMLLFYLAVWSLDVSYWLTGAFIFLLVLIILRVFMMMHDAGHGCLFVSPKQNRIAGFIMGVMCGVPEYVWSKHHAYHHATNGNWEKYRGPLAVLSSTEFAKLQPKQQRAYQRNRNILLAPFGGFLYFIFNPRFTWLAGSIQFLVHVIKSYLTAENKSWTAIRDGFKTKYWADWKEYRHMAANNLVLISGVIAACWLLGTVEFLTIFVIAMSLAGGLGIILFTIQHNFENAYATGTDDWDYHTAALEGTSYLDLPRILHWFTADIGYHHIHHLSARIPNYKLRACHEEYKDLFHSVPTLKLKDVLHSFQYILWDEESGRLITIDQFYEKYGRDETAPAT